MAAREIVASRLLNAPRELVFDAWTDPHRVAQWWGPTGFTTTTHEMAVEPGGVWRFVMHGPDGVDYDNTIVFIEVVRPERLVYSHSGKAGEPIEFHVTATFEDQGGKTLLTMRSVFATQAERDRVVKEFGAIEGAHQTLERLAHYLSAQSNRPA
jgi:uncharacterized protein YndB with AHSA1/START domain